MNSIQIDRAIAAATPHRAPLEIIAAGSVVLLATDAYRMTAFAGLGIGPTFALLVAPLLLFIAVNGPRVFYWISLRRMRAVVIVFLLWPLATVIYTNGIDVAGEAALLALKTVIIVSAIILFLVSDERSSSRLMLMCLLVSAAGAVASVAAPQLFDTMRAAAEASDVFDGRAYGFQLQPNSLAISVVFISLAVLASATGKLRLTGIVVTVAVIAATASRFSILLFLVGLLLYGGANENRRQAFFKAIVTRSKAVWVLLTLWLVAALIFNAFGLSQYAHDGNIFDRLNAILGGSIEQSIDVNGVGSLNLRMEAQWVYFDYIMQHPLLGYGIGAEAAMKLSGEIVLAAHSSFLEQALNFGFPYSLALVLVFAWPLRPWHMKMVRDHACFGLLFAVAFVFNHGLFENYTFLIVFAFFYARTLQARIAVLSAARQRSWHSEWPRAW